jgi:hypothetical protein
LSSNPVSFRFPINVEGKAHEDVVEAIQYHDNAITDLQQAIPSLKSQIDAKTSTSGTASSTTNVTSSSETVVIPGASSTAGIVNDQTGSTSYTTQQSDNGAFILFNDASPIAVTLGIGPVIQTPWYCQIINYGAGTVTVTPPAGSTISYPGALAASSMPIASGSGAAIAYGGTNFDAILFVSSFVPPVNLPSVAGEYVTAYNASTGAFTLSTPAGISATIATAKLTVGGTNGSMTFVGGLLTAQTPAT